MIIPRFSSVWSKTKPIAPFSCTPRVQEVYTKAEVVHLTLGLLGLGVLFNVPHGKCIAKYMINRRFSAVWSKTKPIAPFSCKPRVQEVYTKAEVVHLTPGLQGLGVLFNVPHGKCIAKHMINPRISAVWSTTKPIAPFSCTPSVQEVHTKAEVVHLTPGLQGLGVVFNCHAQEMYCEIYD